MVSSRFSRHVSGSRDTAGAWAVLGVDGLSQRSGKRFRDQARDKVPYTTLGGRIHKLDGPTGIFVQRFRLE
jgi:hypothetical protein